MLGKLSVCVAVDLGGCCGELGCDNLSEIGFKGVGSGCWIGSWNRNRIGRPDLGC
jgi:hypothetical protein